jgi:hypothetical protein
MTDTTTKVRAHYSAANLIERIKSALATIAPEEQTLTVAQLAPLDQFHTLGQHKKRRPTVKKNLLSLAMSLALLMSAATQAQTTHLTITVPFEFTAGNVQLPAGEYEVTAVGPWGGPTLSVHNVNSNAGTLVLSTSCRSQKPAADAKLVFHRYGQQYFLAEVWNRHSSVGNQIKINSRQTELAKNQSKDEVVLIASEK